MLLLIDTLFDEVYLVGGAVRNALLGIKTIDFDFATPENVESIEKKLSENNIKPLTIGKKFGTIAAKIGAYDIQITSYRSESYSSGSRKPKVQAVADIDGDLSRRDFTINAMALSRDEFVDPYEGTKDLRSKIIRIVGDANIKFREDPLRIIRAYRFVSQLGFNIEPETLEAIKENINNLYILPEERVASEMGKILAGDWWDDALYELAESGALTAGLRTFDYVQKVTENNVQTIFDKYTITQIDSMDIVDRWNVLFEIFVEAENKSSIKIRPSQTILKTLLSKLVKDKLIRKNIEANFLERINNKPFDNPNDIEKRLQAEYERLKASNDPRTNIVQSKLLTHQAKAAFKLRHYHEAMELYSASLTSTEKDYEIILTKTNLHLQKNRLDGLKPYYSQRLSGYMASSIMSQWPTRYMTRVKDIQEHLRKKGKLNRRLNQYDYYAAIEEAILLLMLEGHTFEDESLEYFLARKNLHISKSRQEYLLHRYIIQKIRSPLTTSKDKAALNLQLAKSAKRSNGGKPNEKYYEDYTEYLMWKTISSSSLKAFWDNYDEQESISHEYISFADERNFTWAARKTLALNAAKSLIHGLNLATTLSDKLEITELIVQNYRLVGSSSKRNSARFRVYLSWLKILTHAETTDNEPHQIPLLREEIRKAYGYTYIDADESYFMSTLPELSTARVHLRELSAGLSYILGDKVDENVLADTNSTPAAILKLYNVNLITVPDTFRLLKTYYLSMVTETTTNVSISDFQEENELGFTQYVADMINVGENKRTELKASWSYNLKTKAKDKSISEKIIETISALMNTEGGHIIIGVQDNHEISGLEQSDYLIHDNKNEAQRIDTIKKEIDNLFKSKVGAQYSGYFTVKIEKYLQKTLLVIEVMKSTKAIYYADDFYIRLESGNSKLNSRQLLEYMQKK